MSVRKGLLFATILLTSLLVVASVDAQFRPFGKKGAGKKGERNTPPARGERVKTTIKTGDPAPDFVLPTLKGKETVRLSDFQGKKPVVLIFGSYT